MSDGTIDAPEDALAAAFGLGVAATLLWSGIALRAAHGDLATFALSAAIVWLAACLDHGGTRLELFAFGLAVGIGGWQSLPTLFCSALACAWLVLRWPAAQRHRDFAVLTAAGLLLGVLMGSTFGLHDLTLVPRTGLASSPAEGAAEAALGSWDEGEGDR